MLGVFLKSSCTRPPCSALQSKMQRSMVGRFQSPFAMTGTSAFVVFRYFLVGEPHYTEETFQLYCVPKSWVQTSLGLAFMLLQSDMLCMFQGNYGRGGSEPRQVSQLGSQSSAPGQVSGYIESEIHVLPRRKWIYLVFMFYINYLSCLPF